MCEAGYNIMDLNSLYFGASRGIVQCKPQDLLSAMTSGFVEHTECNVNRYSNSDDFASSVEKYLNITKNSSGVKNFDLSLWPSIHVPFWFIVGCVSKFGPWTDFKAINKQVLPLFDLTHGDAADNIDDLDCDMVYKVDMTTLDWRVLPALCAQRSLSFGYPGYDASHPIFYLPGKYNSRPKTGLTGWMPYMALDFTKASGTFSPWSWVVTEPLAIPFVRLRQPQNTHLPVMAIIRGVPICPYTPHHPVSVVMDYPDPPPEWLKKVWSFLKDEGKVAMPNLLRGDIVGAIGAVGIDVVVKAIQSLADKMGDDRKFAGGVTDNVDFQHLSMRE